MFFHFLLMFIKSSKKKDQEKKHIFYPMKTELTNQIELDAMKNIYFDVYFSYIMMKILKNHSKQENEKIIENSNIEGCLDKKFYLYNKLLLQYVKRKHKKEESKYKFTLRISKCYEYQKKSINFVSQKNTNIYNLRILLVEILKNVYNHIFSNEIDKLNEVLDLHLKIFHNYIFYRAQMRTKIRLNIVSFVNSIAS